MSKLTNQQKNYILGQLGKKLRSAEAKLKDKYRVTSITLSQEERFEQLKSGVAKLKDKMPTCYHPNIDDYFTFEGERKRGFDQEGFDSEFNPLQEAMDKAERELILGDAAEARVLLESFEELVSTKLGD